MSSITTITPINGSCIYECYQTSNITFQRKELKQKEKGKFESIDRAIGGCYLKWYACIIREKRIHVRTEQRTLRHGAKN